MEAEAEASVTKKQEEAHSSSSQRAIRLVLVAMARSSQCLEIVVVEEVRWKAARDRRWVTMDRAKQMRRRGPMLLQVEGVKSKQLLEPATDTIQLEVGGSRISQSEASKVKEWREVYNQSP